MVSAGTTPEGRTLLAQVWAPSPTPFLNHGLLCDALACPRFSSLCSCPSCLWGKLSPPPSLPCRVLHQEEGPSFPGNPVPHTQLIHQGSAGPFLCFFLYPDDSLHEVHLRSQHLRLTCTHRRGLWACLLAGSEP